MTTSHDALISVLLAGLTSLNNPYRILDLGCGNGALLRRICAVLPRALCFGVELDRAKVNRANTTLFHERVNVWSGDVYTSGDVISREQYDITIISAGVLLDAPRLTTQLRRCLSAQNLRLLLYAYHDVFLTVEKKLREPVSYGLRYEVPITSIQFLGEQSVFAALTHLDHMTSL